MDFKVKAIEVLEEALLGEFISHYSVGDTWSLCFGQYWLSCQNIISEEEFFLDKLISENYALANSTVDQEFIAKSVVVSSNMRRTVSKLSLDAKSNLKIEFESGNSITIPSNEDVVDWQWCINESGSDP
jgi:hypothetical protein